VVIIAQLTNSNEWVATSRTLERLVLRIKGSLMGEKE
jgi:hypothetical protein